MVMAKPFLLRRSCLVIIFYWVASNFYLSGSESGIDKIVSRRMVNNG